MHVASLELSKTLFELSGWENERSVWSLSNNGWKAVITTKRAFGVQRKLLAYPAYDLGYMLRKLPAYIATHDEYADDYLFKLQPNYEGNEWEAAYWGLERALYLSQDNTPEDAVCKLVIELFNQGILMRDKKGDDSNE